MTAPSGPPSSQADFDREPSPDYTHADDDEVVMTHATPTIAEIAAGGASADATAKLATNLIEDRDALLTALAQLPPRQREAVVLRYWEDLTETQTAEAMGCSVGAVKSNAAKGIAKLRAIPGLAEMVTQGGRSR